jgi:hypothetical protein
MWMGLGATMRRALGSENPVDLPTLPETCNGAQTAIGENGSISTGRLRGRACYSRKRKQLTEVVMNAQMVVAHLCSRITTPVPL